MIAAILLALAPCVADIRVPEFAAHPMLNAAKACSDQTLLAVSVTERAGRAVDVVITYRVDKTGEPVAFTKAARTAREAARILHAYAYKYAFPMPEMSVLLKDAAGNDLCRFTFEGATSFRVATCVITGAGPFVK